MKIFLITIFFTFSAFAQSISKKIEGDEKNNGVKIESKINEIIDKDGDKIIKLDSDLQSIKTYKPSNIYDDVKAIGADNKSLNKKKKIGVYLVKEGDDLKKVSEKIYGTTNKWKELYLLNEGKLNDKDIKVGQKLQYYMPENELKVQRKEE